MDRFGPRENFLPAIMALLAGSAAAFIVLLAPGGALERMVGESGLPAVFAAAEPPLGFTARALIAGAAGLALALAAFLGLSALAGLPNIRLPKLTKLTVRRDVAADQIDEPIAPRARGPILAAEELGAPFDSVTAPPPVLPAKLAERSPVRSERAPPEIQSLAELVQRIEDGMRNRRVATVPEHRVASEIPIAAAPQPADMNAALQDAMATLRRMGARPG